MGDVTERMGMAREETAARDRQLRLLPRVRDVDGKEVRSVYEGKLQEDTYMIVLTLKNKSTSE